MRMYTDANICQVFFTAINPALPVLDMASNNIIDAGSDPLAQFNLLERLGEG